MCFTPLNNVLINSRDFFIPDTMILGNRAQLNRLEFGMQLMDKHSQVGGGRILRADSLL